MDKKIIGIYLRAYGNNSKFIVKRKIAPFQDQYDVYRPWDKIDIVRELIKILDTEIENFLSKIEEVDKKHHENNPHRVRRYFTQNRSDLYPTKDKTFSEIHSYSFKGYWVGTNIGSREITQYVREMCEASEIEFGSISEIKL